MEIKQNNKDMNIEEIKKLYEKLAEIEHQRWADWQKWCHKILRENCPSLELEKVLERWDKQIATEYKDLSEAEKDSDREQVDRYWFLLEQALKENTEEVIKEMLVEEKTPYDFKDNIACIGQESQFFLAEGWCQCCALQKELAKKIKDNI